MTMGFGQELARRIGGLEQELRRLRAGLVRVGTIASVDASRGTITVTYLSGVTSAAMPWFQRGSEHRPPSAGEHVIVLDPSLQGTSAIAIAGHPSAANPPAGGGGERHVLHADPGGDSDSYAGGSRTLRVQKLVADCPDVRLGGADPQDAAALASKVDAFISALHQVFTTWAPAPNDGGAALKAAFSSQFSRPPASVAAAHVKVV